MDLARIDPPGFGLIASGWAVFFRSTLAVPELVRFMTAQNEFIITACLQDRLRTIRLPITPHGGTGPSLFSKGGNQ